MVNYTIGFGTHENSGHFYLLHEKAFTEEEFKALFLKASLAVTNAKLVKYNEWEEEYGGTLYRCINFEEILKDVGLYMVEHFGFINGNPEPFLAIWVDGWLDLVEEINQPDSLTGPTKELYDFVHPETFKLYTREQRNARKRK